MRILSQRSFGRASGVVMALGLIALAMPAAAHAQYSAPELRGGAVGERYHVEVSGTIWDSSPTGQIESAQFGLQGSSIDLTNDLGYGATRFKDLRVVLRPTKRAKFLVQYTPIDYTAQTSLKRNIVFNGQLFSISLPIQSDFSWKVLRAGYEYDVLYKPRGFVGMLLEARYTQFGATLKSPLLNEYTIQKAPLPALGVVARAYVLLEVAINFQVTGFKVPNSVKSVQANYYDWDINGTVNVSNNVGLQVGWRRMTTFLNIKNDMGNLKFQGMWFGAALRY